MIAVENVFEQLEEQGLIFLTTKTNEMTISISASDYLDIKRLAKEMEKQQIIDAYVKGFCISAEGFNGEYGINDFNNIKEEISAEQYYNETYGSKGSDEYPHSHIYETIGGKYGLSSYNEHDQTDGIFNTYQEAVDFGLSLIKLTHTYSQTEISDEEIEKRVKEVGAMGEYYKMGYRDAIIWYREQLKNKQ